MEPASAESAIFGKALEREAYYSLWRSRLWTTHLWLSGLSYVFAVLVPFGLALLLYAPAEWRLTINISTLVGSCLSLILYGIDQVQRLPDRALLLKRCEYRLNLAVAEYQSGMLTEQQLSGILSTVMDDHSKGDGV